MIHLLNLFQAWSRSNLDMVFFAYGLSFVVMGVAIIIQPKSGSSFKLARIFWILAGFALIHGVVEFCDMWMLIKGKTLFFQTAHWIILTVSYLCLFEFGRRLFCFTAEKFYWRKVFSTLAGAWLLACPVILVYFIDSVDLRNILARYFLGFPACLLVALAAYLYYQAIKKEIKSTGAGKYFFLFGAAFFAYAFLAGLIVPKGSFFISSWLNTDSFLSWAHIPVQVFRALCALFGTIGVCGILRVFNWESQRKAHEALVVSQGITDGIEEAIMLIDTNYKILWANKKQKSLCKEAVGGYCYQVTHHQNSPCQPPHDICPIREVRETGKVAVVVHEHSAAAGDKKYIEVSAYPVKSVEGEIVEFVHISRDITERIRAEEEIKKNYDIQKGINSLLSLSLQDISLHQLLNKALDIMLAVPHLSFKSSGCIFLIKDNPEVLVLEAERGFSESQKASCAEVPFDRCICGKVALSKKSKFVDCVNEEHETSYAGMPPHGHYCVPIVFGSKVIGVLSLLGVLNMYVESGHAYNQKEEEFMKMFADVLAGIIMRKQAETQLEAAYSKLKATETQLVQAAKMAGVGQLAAGIAHEINNPLTGVLNNIQLVKMQIASKRDFNVDDFKEVVDAIEESAMRCKKIVRELLDFSRAPKDTAQVFSLNNVIEKALDFVGLKLESENILFKKQLQPDLPLISGNPQLLEQAILDIIFNAKWAIQSKAPKDGGLITIKSEYIPQKNMVLLAISDTGIGIPRENLAKVFEPFFTTKPVGQGTGLGLSIVYGIIKQHGGIIEAESSPEEGSVFSILLPVLRKEAA